MYLSLPIRPIGYLLAATAVLGFGIDAGSVALTRIAVPDDVVAAGQAAASAVEGMPVNQRAASVAWAAAADDARHNGLRVKAKNFRLHPDGHVELTASRIAPTLLINRLEPLRHLARVKASATAQPLPFS